MLLRIARELLAAHFPGRIRRVPCHLRASARNSVSIWNSPALGARPKRLLGSGLSSVIGGLVLGACALAGNGASGADEWPHFQEVLRLLRTNLEGISEDELNRAVVQGLLDHFHPRVILVTKKPADEAGAGRVSNANVFDKWYGYLRIERIGPGLAREVTEAYAKLSATNQLKGLVLDLRFAIGQDYEAAAGVADRFLTKERPLLNWESGSAKSNAKEDAIT